MAKYIYKLIKSARNSYTYLISNLSVTSSLQVSNSIQPLSLLSGSNKSIERSIFLTGSSLPYFSTTHIDGSSDLVRVQSDDRVRD